MKKLTALGVLIVLVVGLLPLLWLRPGYIISNGDNIPPSLNADKTFRSSTNMWSPDYLGYASPNPAYLLNTYFAASLSYLGLSVDFIQIIIQILLYMGAGLSMYLFSRTVYPGHKISPFFAVFFYMFNLMVIDSRFNLGFAWCYTFLPVLLALFIRIINATYERNKKSANINIVFFSLVSVVALSVASVNPTNVALILFALTVFIVYFLIKHRKNLVPLFFVIGKIMAISIPINIWWIFPMLNTFIFSPVALNSEVNLTSWIWTHTRSSFLNLFWLNGAWGWLPEYVPYISYYSNPLVAISTFIPFLAGGSALFFRTNKSRFNAYIMLWILFFMFLAKGIHEPFGQLNLLLYQNISLMSMFREPASKFTLLIIPFLGLLIGYTAENLSKINLKVKPNRLKLVKLLVLLFLAASFVISAFPLLNGFVQTKTDEIPFSSYIQIPQYWYGATDWINNQPGEWKVLLTPLNDFYQMPYEWGYYGSDQLLERLFEKPIISTAALDGYVTNANTSANLIQIRASVKFNQKDEFKALIDLLGIKYIVQRNDIRSSMVGKLTERIQHNLKSPSEMKDFFSNQSYLKMVISFGKIDIYEYLEAKPSVFALLPSTIEKTDIHIDKNVVLDKTWNFSYQDSVEVWKASTLSNQSQATCLIEQKNGQLRADMWNLTDSWITVDSPVLTAEIASNYVISAEFSARNNAQVNLKIAEYSENMTLLTNSSLVDISLGNFDSYSLVSRFEPKNQMTKYFNVQIWNLFIENQTIQASLMLDFIKVDGTVTTLNMTGIEHFYNDISENQDTQILQVQHINPEKIVTTINTTRPFILASGQELDRFWVAYVKGQKITPIPVYLGLKGFMIEETGQFDVVMVYQPQDWFNFCLAISGVTLIICCMGLVYLNRQEIKGLVNKIKKQSEM